MTPTPTPAPILFDPAVHMHLVPSFATLHETCITSPPYTIATFLPPLSHDLMIKWWEARVAEVSEGARVILFLLSEEEHVVAGYVMLGMPFSETGPFRGSVEKLLVDPKYRGKGFAKVLMGTLENIAREKGRTLLMLDTEKGSPAEVIYPRLGWTKIGEVPEYGISAKAGTLKSGVFFYKDLRVMNKGDSMKEDNF